MVLLAALYGQEFWIPGFYNFGRGLDGHHAHAFGFSTFVGVEKIFERLTFSLFDPPPWGPGSDIVINFKI